MPTYEYKCKNCSHELEEFQSMKDEPLVMCPVCHTPNLVRMIGNGAGLIFKGQGFYLTDYKKGSSPATTSSGSSKNGKSPKSNGSDSSSSSSSSESSAPPAGTDAQKSTSSSAKPDAPKSE